MKRSFILLIVCLFLIPYSQPSYGQFWKKKKKKTEHVKIKKKTPYERFFNKKHETKKGMITLHKMDNKIYFEFPLNLLERDMILGSTVSEISDNGEAIVGQKPHWPLHIKFTKIDSSIQLRKIEEKTLCNPNESINKALKSSNIGAIIKTFPIKLYNNDSTAVILNVTDFFISDNSEIDPFDPYGANTFYGFVSRTSRFKKQRSCLGEIKAFDDNIIIKSHLTFTVDLKVLGMFQIQKDKPVTAVMTRSLILLPEEKMRPRYADPRIGIFFSGKQYYTEKEDGMRPIYYAHRWRLEPKNIEAYKKGELVEPKKPIVFYIDNTYPDSWKKYVKLGVEDWNSAFEKIGFKNAVIAKFFPTKEEDPEFDPDNIKYSCLRYAPIWIANSMGPSWVDPRTGEIINASVYSFHNIAQLIRNWRFIQTAQIDKKVRTKNIDEETFGASLRYVIAHEIGHTLGLMHNMSASAAIPTDSLRSAKFTQKYGTTYSIMDYARYNYVAQPGDKGVKLTPPKIGVYDYYAIEWLYKPIFCASTSEQEVPILDKWISEKAGNPIYRYGKQQIRWRVDPSSQTEDIGDDAIKSSSLGINNLKYILNHLNEWLKDEDKDFSFREELYSEVIRQYKRYIGHVQMNLGGMYLNETYEGDPNPKYQSVPREKQKKALKFLLKQIKDLDWIENKEILKNFRITGAPAKELKENIFSRLLKKTNSIAFCAYKSDDPYNEKEYLNDIYKFVWKSTNRRKNPSESDRKIQSLFIENLIKNATTSGSKGKITIGITDPEEIELSDLKEKLKNYNKETLPFYNSVEFEKSYNEEHMGFEWARSPIQGSFVNISHRYFSLLMKTKDLLEKNKNFGSYDTKAHYKLLLFRINKALEK